MDQELVKIFVDEMGGEVDALEEILIDLREDSSNKQSLKELGRVLHNMKGNSAIIGLMEFSSAVHVAEKVLGDSLETHGSLSTARIKLFLVLVDKFREVINELNSSGQTSVQFKDLEDKFENILNHEESENSENSENEMATLIEMGQEEQGNNLSGPFQSDSTQSQKHQEEPEVKVDLRESKKKKTVVDSGITNINVNLKRIDHLLNLIGELVIHQNMANEHVNAQKPDIEKLENIVGRLNSIVKDVRESAFALRMTPLSKTFKKLKRTVLDISDDLNKPIIVNIDGSEAELDRGVVEKMSTPLMHIVRNAMAHGIEDPFERSQIGKPLKAQIKISAKQSDDMVCIAIEDDGRGLQRKKILEKAIEKGLCSKSEDLTDEKVFSFIFESNFSTKSKEEINDLAGRGVGMDVVRSSVEELGGDIKIKSEEGKGTTFLIYLPLSLSIIDGLVCTDNSNHYIIPLSHVDEVIQVNPKSVGIVNGRGHMIPLRKEEVPLYGLEDTLQKKKSLRQLPAEEFICVVSAVGGKRKAFKVDNLEGVQQLVIKPLGEEFQGIPGMVGGAILGSGSAGIIIDMYSLIIDVAA